MNKLYFGDNLDILREYIKDETVDLTYLGAAPFQFEARLLRALQRRRRE
ncbi:MAG: hypothetical protein Q8922_04140 [Bacteroidota bacterium]|nr:hypothetical protein [Bacteroidota bacterium]MDP4231770.1 hypothetical protein [Bacteroidota bacterium]MDP4243506.1 hypothetical protein [Bacteroidota bacterium]MDP4287107.1 hypothetical protein [Bacteroidota bacterium]